MGVRIPPGALITIGDIYMKWLRRSIGKHHETYNNIHVMGMSGNKFALIAIPISLLIEALVLYWILLAIDAIFNTSIVPTIVSYFN